MITFEAFPDPFPEHQRGILPGDLAAACNTEQEKRHPKTPVVPSVLPISKKDKSRRAIWSERCQKRQRVPGTILSRCLFGRGPELLSPFKYSDLSGTRAAGEGPAASASIQGLANDPLGSGGVTGVKADQRGCGASSRDRGHKSRPLPEEAIFFPLAVRIKIQSRSSHCGSHQDDRPGRLDGGRGGCLFLAQR